MEHLIVYEAARDHEGVLRFLAECRAEAPESSWQPERFEDLVTRVDALWTAGHEGQRLTDFLYLLETDETITALILPDGDNFCVCIRRGQEACYPRLLAFGEERRAFYLRAGFSPAGADGFWKKRSRCES